MHLVVDAARQKVKALRVDLFISMRTDALADLFDQTVLNQHVGDKLLIFVYDGGGLDQDGAHKGKYKDLRFEIED